MPYSSFNLTFYGSGSFGISCSPVLPFDMYQVVLISSSLLTLQVVYATSSDYNDGVIANVTSSGTVTVPVCKGSCIWLTLFRFIILDKDNGFGKLLQ